MQNYVCSDVIVFKNLSRVHGAVHLSSGESKARLDGPGPQVYKSTEELNQMELWIYDRVPKPEGVYICVHGLRIYERAKGDKVKTPKDLILSL